MWVRFTKDFDWEVPGTNGHSTIAYKANAVENVTRECAEAAKAADKAVDHTPEKGAEEKAAGKPAEKLDAEADRRG